MPSSAPNGAGKSTTFNLISGRIAPSSGEIRLNGELISGLQPFQINRRGLSRSFQVTNVFAKMMTVWENVRCAVLWATGHRYAFWKNVDNLPEVRQRTAQILDDIHLSHRRDVPAGLLTYAEQARTRDRYYHRQRRQRGHAGRADRGMSNAETERAVALIRRLTEGERS